MNSKKIVYGVYNSISKHSKNYQRHVRDITYFSVFLQLFLYKDIIFPKVVESNKIDDIINKAYNTGSEWLFLISYGTRFYDHKIVEKLIRLTETSESKIFGHILQTKYPDGSLGKNEYLLHPQSFLLNLKTWNEIGQPSFGSTGVYKVSRQVGKRSAENFHDDYTPYWLKPTGKVEKISGYFETGWNIINVMLSNKLKIDTLPKNIKDSKGFFYPEDRESDLEQRLLNSEYKANSKYHHTYKNYFDETDLSVNKNQIYIHNTESILTDHILNSEERFDADNIYSVASGFKPFLLYSKYAHNNTRLILYDYSKPTLDFKKWLIENWDGKNYSSISKKYVVDVEPQVRFSWHGEVNIDLDKNSIEQEFKNIQNYFGGKQEWLKFWNKFTQLDHKYITVDLINNYHILIEDMKSNKGNNLVWTSNIYYSEPIIRNYTPTTLLKQYGNFKTSIELHSKKTSLLGAEPLTTKQYEIYTL